MTIQGWVLFGILALFILSFGIFGAIIFEKIVWKVLGIVAAMLLIIGLFAGMRWYYQNISTLLPRCTGGRSSILTRWGQYGEGRSVSIYLYFAGWWNVCLSFPLARRGNASGGL